MHPQNDFAIESVYSSLEFVLHYWINYFGLELRFGKPNPLSLWGKCHNNSK